VDTITESPGSPSAESLISMAEIAELASVQRPVITTWRRRHRDFPAPVSADSARPLFGAHEVADWLIRTGRADPGELRPELSLYTLSSLTSMLPARALVAVLTALICLRHLDGDEPLADGADDLAETLQARAWARDPEDRYLAAEITRMPFQAARLAPVVDEFVEAAWGCAGAYERLMGARNRLRVAELFSDAVTAPAARLMAELSGVRQLALVDQSPLVSDLNVGAGDLFTAVTDLLGPDMTPMFTGAEPDEFLGRIARRRLLVHGIPALDLHIRIGGELPDEAGEPDAIITQLPYRPGEERGDADIIARLDDISVRLPRGRTAVVLGPASVLAGDLPPYSAAERRRADLISSGMVEAVIRLPGGTLPYRPGYEPALWVITSSFGSPWAGRILLADVSDKALTDEIINGLTSDVVTWRRDGYEPRAHSRQFCTEELISDLAEQPGPLSSRRRRSRYSARASADARVGRISEIQAGLTDATNQRATRQAVASHLTAGRLLAPETITLGKLIARRKLALARGTRLRTGDLSTTGQHAVIGPDEVLAQSRPGAKRIDRAVLATAYPHAQLTEPGDVIVTTVPALGAMVDDAGFSVVAFPARAIRISERERDRFTPRVLAALIRGGETPHRPAGAIRLAHRLEDLPLPQLSTEDVRRLDSLLAIAAEREQRARCELELLSELTEITAAGLTDGTLAFASDPA